MVVLRDYTDHQPDPTVIPDDATVGDDYLQAVIRDKGLI